MQFPGHTLPASFRRSAAEYLGAVLLDLFPRAKLLGGGATSLGFYYEVEVDSPLQEPLLPLMEQKLLTLLKGEESVQIVEMMRENAANMQLHLQQPILAERIRSYPGNIVALAQIGAYRGVPDGEIEKDVTPIRTLKLLQIFPSKKFPKGMRIEGAIFTNPNEKKQFIKEHQRYFKERDHRVVGEEMGLFRLLLGEDSWIWYPKGVLFKQLLQKCIDRCIDSQDYRFLPIEMRGRDLKKSHCQFWEACPVGFGTCQGILDRNEGVWQPLQECGFLGRRRGERFSLLVEKRVAPDISSSLLQRIESWVRMLGLQACWRGRGNWPGSQLPLEIGSDLLKRGPLPNHDWIELCLFDKLGRSWPGPFIEKIPLREGWILFGDWVGGIEQIAALVIEQHEGHLPVFLSPEQVRVLPADTASIGYGAEVGEVCCKEGVRCEVDTRLILLRQKVFEAEKERVPYLLLVGEKERRSAQVMVRSVQGQKMWKLNEFLNLIKGEDKTA